MEGGVRSGSLSGGYGAGRLRRSEANPVDLTARILSRHPARHKVASRRCVVGRGLQCHDRSPTCPSRRNPRRLGKMQRLVPLLLFGAVLGSWQPAAADEVGRVGVDWTGNDIVVEAIKDPSVEGVTCHVSYFDRSVIDRLHKGNWFEDPSDSSIACR